MYWTVIANGLEFRHSIASDKIYWTGEIRGLGKGDIRTATGINSGADGGYVGEQLLGLREIPLSLFIHSQDLAEFEGLMKQVNAAFPINSYYDLRFITPAGNQYVVKDCKTTEMDPHISDVQTLCDYSITVVSGDTTIYEYISGSDINSVYLTRSVNSGGIEWADGGIEWEATGIEWADGEPAKTITNTGEADAYPTITISGKTTNPVFTNQTTGRVLSLNIATSASDVIVIDFMTSTAALNGMNIFYNISSDDFWSLLPGDNIVEYSSDSNDDNATVLLEWRSGFQGIM